MKIETVCIENKWYLNIQIPIENLDVMLTNNGTIINNFLVKGGTGYILINEDHKYDIYIEGAR